MGTQIPLKMLKTTLWIKPCPYFYFHHKITSLFKKREKKKSSSLFQALLYLGKGKFSFPLCAINLFPSAFLMSLLKNAATDAWVGLNDINQEHVYLWTDGSPVYYTNWAKGSRSYYSKVNINLWLSLILDSFGRLIKCMYLQ